jgi:serine acetyltransferase
MATPPSDIDVHSQSVLGCVYVGAGSVVLRNLPVVAAVVTVATPTT